MSEQQHRLHYLLELYANEKANSEEVSELFILVNKSDDASLENLLANMLATTEPENDENRKRRLLSEVLQKINLPTTLSDADKKDEKSKVRRISWTRVAAAAVIILLISIGSYVILRNEGSKEIASTETLPITIGIKNDIAPGKQGAILTLANGKTMVLDTAHNGKLLDNFTKTDESISVESAAMEYATLSTPRARTQQLTLSDGSKVWLNAASSIHFPTLFYGKERVVEITGEVYFEVTKNAAKPFRVKIITPSGDGGEVEVLGTHFNINAYPDESSIKTTLLEGSVKVSTVRGQQSTVIKPGQQAQLQTTNLPTGQAGYKLQIVNVDLNEAIAWQRGLFELNNTELPAIMRQISRWYDVDIVYEGKPGNEKFGGGISKNLPLSNVLKLLEANGVKFSLEGKVLKVKP